MLSLSSNIGTGMAPLPQDAQDYGQYLRRCFFERLVTGQLSLQQLHAQAETLGLDLQAQTYTIAFVSAVTLCPETDARIRDDLAAHFLKYPEYILFQWDLTTYAVLIQAAADKIAGCIQRCIQAAQAQYEAHGLELKWYVAVGEPIPQLSMLPHCFEDVSRLWAYRYIFPHQHILTGDTVRFFTHTDSNQDLAELDVAKVDPAVVTDVLQNASAQALPDFVDAYIHSMEAALQFDPFCQYLMLSVRFTATAFAQTLGISQKDFLAPVDCVNMVGRYVTGDDLKQYLYDILLRAIQLRDNAAQCRSLLDQAVAYIDANYQDKELSLNRVAQAVNLSPNYFSAVFRQEKGMTFIEYVTGKRMEKARQLLRATDLRSGQVATAVGYGDPHYFSYLFKKTQGCTPGAYRAGKE